MCGYNVSNLSFGVRWMFGFKLAQFVSCEPKFVAEHVPVPTVNVRCNLVEDFGHRRNIFLRIET